MSQPNSGISTMAAGQETRPERQPFKLCFPEDTLMGKSDMRMSKPDDDVTTMKVNDENDEEDLNVTTDDVDSPEESKESTEQEKKDERFKNDQASLSSHEYGWWYEEEMPTKDACIDSHKKLNAFPNLN